MLIPWELRRRSISVGNERHGFLPRHEIAIRCSHICSIYLATDNWVLETVYSL